MITTYGLFELEPDYPGSEYDMRSVPPISLRGPILENPSIGDLMYEAQESPSVYSGSRYTLLPIYEKEPSR